ncbi:MAG: AI-2E family transporter, partial [Clostridia bacterium]|nr:AI-2E family transporter [Clostridia bacterium]
APKLDGLTGLLPGLATGTVAFAGGFADAVSRLSRMLMLCFFFLCDRDRLLLRLELLVPLRYRADAVRAGRALSRELRLYLKAQLTIALAVGVLSAAGLWLVGVRSAATLGGIVGLLNMIPYFGPFIGGVPAVLIALGDGPVRAALCLGALTLVQQADAALLSPRIMGSLTGFSPAAVLLSIYGGASLGGVPGMLCALPLMMSARTIFRVFITSRENI